MHVDFTREESHLLRHTLERQVEEVRHEVHHTGGREARDELIHRENLLRQMLDKLRED
jgi:hypothetical protein